jgi:hypothetical protein
MIDGSDSFSLFAVFGDFWIFGPNVFIVLLSFYFSRLGGKGKGSIVFSKFRATVVS